MKYNGVIEAKIRVIDETLLEIESWQIDSFSAFKANYVLQKAVERTLQIVIEAIIDIGEHILALNKWPCPSSSSAVICRLQEVGMISDDEEYTNMIRFRNFIVHRYEKVDLAIVYNILKNKLSVFHKFVNEIRQSCS